MQGILGNPIVQRRHGNVLQGSDPGEGFEIETFLDLRDESIGIQQSFTVFFDVQRQQFRVVLRHACVDQRDRGIDLFGFKVVVTELSSLTLFDHLLIGFPIDLGLVELVDHHDHERFADVNCVADGSR